MLSYADLIRTVRQHEPLVKGIRSMMEKDGVLDLAVSNWRERLDGSLLAENYRKGDQHMLTPSYTKPGGRYVVQKVRNSNHFLHVIFAGYWKQLKVKNGSVMLQCLSNEVVGEICNIVSSDLEGAYRRDASAKFYVENCSRHACNDCRTGVQFYRLHDPPAQMCIAKSKIFDGKIVKNMFQSIFLESQSTFMGLVSVVISSLVSWNDFSDPSVRVVRIGGTIESCILFKPSSVLANEPLTFDDDDDRAVPNIRSSLDVGEKRKRLDDGSDEEGAKSDKNSILSLARGNTAEGSKKTENKVEKDAKKSKIPKCDETEPYDRLLAILKP